MPPEMWMLVAVFAVGALVLGFIVGRVSAPREGRFRQVEQQLNDAKGELDDVRTSVNHHFEESARLFGELARDYRALFGHFAESAQRMGFSNDETQELLRRANRQLAAPSPDQAPAPEEVVAEAAQAAQAAQASISAAGEATAPPADASPSEATREIEEGHEAPAAAEPEQPPARAAAQAPEPTSPEASEAPQPAREESLESQEQPIRRGD